MPQQVLVKLLYAGINGGCETFRVRGEHWFASNQSKANFPLGAEGAGVIVAVGPDVENLKVRVVRRKEREDHSALVVACRLKPGAV